MRGIVWIVLLFVVAVVAATTLGSNDGLVTLYWAGWRTDLSLNLFVILVLGSCALLMLAAKALSALLSLPRRAEDWRSLRRERAAQTALRQALAEYMGARYGRARKAAEQALAVLPRSRSLAADIEFRLLAQLLAAGSRHRLQDHSGRDEVLQQALQVSGKRATSAQEATRLMAAEWALDDGDAQRALELLHSLVPGAARRTHALRLKLRATRMARQPLEALHTARLLAKHQAFSPAVAQGLLRALAAEALESVHDHQQLQRLWGQLDTSDRRDPHVVSRAASRAVQLGEAAQARQWLRPFWSQLDRMSAEQRAVLAQALVDARHGIEADWLPSLESAGVAFGQEAAVQAAVGMVLSERQLWGKARSPLAHAAAADTLSGRSRRAAWRELAAIARHQSQEEEAQRCERAAAAVD